VDAGILNRDKIRQRYREMLYEPELEHENITPFYEDEEGYIFRFFCGADSPPRLPRVQSIPKSNPLYICLCGARLSVGHDDSGPYLQFIGGGHFGAKEATSQKAG
jgi:hypothetical protein